MVLGIVKPSSEILGICIGVKKVVLLRSDTEVMAQTWQFIFYHPSPNYFSNCKNPNSCEKISILWIRIPRILLIMYFKLQWRNVKLQTLFKTGCIWMECLALFSLYSILFSFEKKPHKFTRIWLSPWFPLGLSKWESAFKSHIAYIFYICSSKNRSLENTPLKNSPSSKNGIY